MPSFGQIVPPAMDQTNIAGWFAVAIRQELDPIPGKGWQSTTYIGLGRMSNPDNHNPLYKPGVVIVNQEFQNKFHKNWKYSLAVSYRRQNEYSNLAPYDKGDPPSKQEFRLYGRFSYVLETPFVKIEPTFRQEFQKYYTPHFKAYREDTRLRSRFRLKFTFPLTRGKAHKILLYSEQLFAVSRDKELRQWTAFAYTDSRFTLYYSYAPKKIPFVFNLGYMNNLAGVKPATSTHYFGMDIGWINPFGLRP